VLSQLSEKNIKSHEITLHVGAGTFQPVKSDTILGHTMHHEKVIISKKFINELISSNHKVIAVGTTSVRSLESLYWLGVQLENNERFNGFPEISQWEPYENETKIPVKKLCKISLIFWIKPGKTIFSFQHKLLSFQDTNSKL
jgi:S-adenosylmethionine:tRNA ribosyltransferase-isomerase